MILLLDSHVVIWALYEPHRLGKKTLSLIASLEQGCVSRASMVELTFKYGSSKLPHPPEAISEGVHMMGATIVEITDRHLQTYSSVILEHKDPFDRLLVAQAISEGIMLLTADTHLLSSPYPTLDARL